MKILSNTLNKNIIISQLHPGILAMASKVFISNYFSYTLSTANLLSVPTIEYTEYNKNTLNITKQGSMYPEYVDYFINRDKNMLKDAIISSLNKRKKNYNFDP